MIRREGVGIDFGGGVNRIVSIWMLGWGKEEKLNMFFGF